MRNIINEVRLLLSSQFGKNTFYVYITQVVCGIIGFLLNLILIRNMDVQDYGLFSLYSSASMLLAGVLHLSWNETFNRFGSKFYGESIFPSLNKFVFQNVIRSILFISIVFFIFSGWISEALYQRPVFNFYFKLAIINAVILALCSYFNIDTQIKQLFKKYFYSQLYLYLARLVLVGSLIYFSIFSLSNLISVYVLVPLIFVIYYGISIGLHQKTFWNSAPLAPEIKQQAKSFRNWALLSAISNQLIGNIDLSILAHYHPNEVLAQYGASGRLTLPLHMAIAAIGMVLLPKIASTRDPDVTRLQLKKLAKYLIPIGAIFFVISFFIPPLLAKLAGGEYADSQNVMLYFLFSTVIVFLTNPPSIFLIAWGHVRMAAVLNIVQLVIDIALDLLWIPEKGALGAIQATCVVHLIGMFFAYYQVYRAVNGKLKPHQG